MKKYGVDIGSQEAWDDKARSYTDRLTSEYHDHRLAVINALIPDRLYRDGASILDFGCGDAVHFEQFLSKGCRIRGVDVSAEMIELARQRLSALKRSPDLASVGGAADLAGLDGCSLDAIMSFNVLAYLTDEEEDRFYREAHRILRPGGNLIVTHSNELFDLFSLNQYTADFFRRHLVSDADLRGAVDGLITSAAGDSSTMTYNVRENPLAYRFKLAKYGFVEERQEFINLHPAPPPLLEKDKPFPDTLSWREEERWKLMFVCSIYGSLSTKRTSKD